MKISIIIIALFGVCACGDESEEENGENVNEACLIRKSREHCKICAHPDIPDLIIETCESYTVCGSCPEEDRDGGGCYLSGILFQCEGESQCRSTYSPINCDDFFGGGS